MRLSHSKYLLTMAVLVCLASMLFGLPISTTAQTEGNPQHWTQTRVLGQGSIMSAVWRPNDQAIVVNSSQGAWIYSSNLQLQRHDETLTRVLYSADGQRLVGIGRDDGAIFMADANDLDTKHRLPLVATINVMGLNRDGSLLAIGGTKNIWLWDEQKAQLSVLAPAPIFVSSLVWDAAGKRLAVGGFDSVQIFDIGAESTLSLLVQKGGYERNYRVAWSPNGQEMATVTGQTSNSADSNTLQIWDTSSGELLRIFQSGLAIDVDWNPVNGLIVTAVGRSITQTTSDGPSVRVWNPATGDLVADLTAFYTQNVLSVRWSPDGKYLLSAAKDDTVRIWDWPLTRFLDNHVLQGFMNAVTTLAWSPDGKRLVSGSEDGGMRVWDAATGRVIRMQPGSRPVWSVAWSADGQQIASAHGDYTAMATVADTGSLNTLTRHRPFTFDNNITGVLAVAINRDGVMATGGSDGEVHIAQPGNGDFPEILRGRGSVYSVAWSPDGNTLAYAQGAIKLWNVNNHEPIAELTCGVDGIAGQTAFSSDGKRIASYMNVGEICVWNASSHTVINTIEYVGGSFVWQPNSHQLAVVESDPDGRVIQLWNTENGEIHELFTAQSPVLSMAWSPDGKRLAVGSSEGTISIWEQG